MSKVHARDRTYPPLSEDSPSTDSSKKDSSEKRSNPPQSQIARKVAESLHGRFLWDEVSSEWLTQKYIAWKPCRLSELQRAVAEILESELTGYSISYLSGVIALLRIHMTAPNWETGNHRLPFRNGVLDLKTHVFIHTYYNPSYSSDSSNTGATAFVNSSLKSANSSEAGHFNWELPYDYNPKATCWTFRRWLVTATNHDRDLIKFLLAWLVAVLRGRYDLQKYLEMTGPGGTGKSTFLRICALLVGEENRVITDLKNLEGRFETANLYGKRLVQITDSQHYNGEVSVLKSITGGDPIRFEKKNKQAGPPFVFTGLVEISTNEVIKSSDYTSGLSRRRIPLEMAQRVTEEQKRRYRPYGGIETLIANEIPGIINWLLTLDESKATEIIRNPGDSVARFQFEAELQSNPLLAWAFDSLTLCPVGDESQIGVRPPDKATAEEIETAASQRLYPNYCFWCDGQGLKPISVVRFSSNVVDILTYWGVKTEKYRKAVNGGTALKGLRLRKSGDSELIESIRNQSNEGFDVTVKAVTKAQTHTTEEYEGYEGLNKSEIFSVPVDEAIF